VPAHRGPRSRADEPTSLWTGNGATGGLLDLLDQEQLAGPIAIGKGQRGRVPNPSLYPTVSQCFGHLDVRCLAVAVTSEMLHYRASIAHLSHSKPFMMRWGGEALPVGAKELRVSIGDDGIEPHDPDRCQASHVLSQRVGTAEASMKVVDLRQGERDKQIGRASSQARGAESAAARSHALTTPSTARRCVTPPPVAAKS
jgi:hypothetical protein